MAQKTLLAKVLGFVAWLTGVIVALAVGMSLTDGSISLGIGETLDMVAGWLVIVATIVSVVLAIIHSLKK